ncbi:MAG: AAA family ATPase [Ktedonobacteraceae bacterium]
MKKIAIIGSAGAGKTTLARSLHSILNIRVVHLDRVFWQPRWKKKPKDARREIIEKIVKNREWIIEGTYLSLSEARLDAADTIIFLDVNPFICIYRIFRRHRLFWPWNRLINKQQRDRVELKRRDLPEGSVDKLTPLYILKVLFFPLLGRRTLIKKLDNYDSKEVHYLQSTKEVEAFLAQLEAQTNEKNNSARIPSTPRNRQLALERR